MINPEGTPYHNLILTGFMGTGKLNVVRLMARKVGVQWIDLPTEVQMREGLPPHELRQIFGEARLKQVEADLCRELALQRGAVLSVNGTTLLEPVNRERLLNSGPVLVLTCALNEVLRRLHASQGARFHDPKVRASELNLLRREQQVLQLEGLPTLDTTTLTVEQVAEQAIAFWYELERVAV